MRKAIRAASHKNQSPAIRSGALDGCWGEGLGGLHPSEPFNWPNRLSFPVLKS